MKNNTAYVCFRYLYYFMALLFIPVLLTVCFAGDDLPYYDYLKMHNPISNRVLLLGIIPFVFLLLYLLSKFENKLNTKKAGHGIDVFIVIASVALCFLNLWIAREIAFKLPWDIHYVTGYAQRYAEGEPLGYEVYCSIYTNNLPIIYILGKIYRFAQTQIARGSYSYPPDYLWIQMNCVFFSLGAIFTSLTAKKITDSSAAELLSLFYYLAIVGISPWKIEPYTDAYGLIYPIMAVYFYVSYRKSEGRIKKYIELVLALLSAVVGGLIKPNIYIVLIAIILTEAVHCVSDFKKGWTYFAVMVICTLMLLGGAKSFSGYIMNELGLDFNKEIQYDWHHYFLMGLNEETTGSYNMDDVGMIGRYQTSKAERVQAEMEGARERIEERGAGGMLYFWLKKMVMSFNDGTFGWKTEIGHEDEFPDTVPTNTIWTLRFRALFWGEDKKATFYEVGTHFAWLLCLMGIPGIVFEKKKDWPGSILAVSFLGIFFYLMLFETRARYLFVFAPIIIVLSVYGMQQYERKLWKK